MGSLDASLEADVGEGTVTGGAQGPSPGEALWQALALAGGPHAEGLQGHHVLLLPALEFPIRRGIASRRRLRQSLQWLVLTLASDQNHAPRTHTPAPSGPTAPLAVPTPLSPAYWSSHPWTPQALPATCSFCWEWSPQAAPLRPLLVIQVLSCHLFSEPFLGKSLSHPLISLL